jgi:hypothetical protein
MSKEQDGGPAFPDQGQRMEGDGKWNQQWSPGMSLRDWFAGQALIGIVADDIKQGLPADGLDIRHVADAAYRYADAMLEARKK